MSRTGIARAVIACLIIVVVSSCTEETKIYVPSDYADWEKTVDNPLTHPIPGHTSRWRVIHINETGTDVLIETVEDEEQRYTYPEGTILVKENYEGEGEGGGELEGITAMIKTPGDPNSVGGWVWVMKDPDTGNERIFSESANFCFICHSNANDRHPYGDRNRSEEFRDYVYYPYEPSE